MAGGSGQTMPNGFEQTQAGGGDKGTGQPAATPMGTPIVYGKTYLPQSSLSSNPPLSSAVVDRVNQELNTQSPGSSDGVGGSGGTAGVSSDGMGTGVGVGTGGAAQGDSGDGGTGAASTATGDGGGGGSGGK